MGEQGEIIDAGDFGSSVQVVRRSVPGIPRHECRPVELDIPYQDLKGVESVSTR